MKRAFVLSLGILMSASAVQAEDLKAVYERALVNDPQIREADALRNAARESKPQALAALLPQVSGSASRTKWPPRWPSWPLPRRATSPAPNCTSTAACS